MAGFVTLDIDASGLDIAIPAITRAAGVGAKQATLSESRSILQTALNRTKMEARAKTSLRVEKKFRRYAGGHIGSMAVGETPGISIAKGAGHVWWLDRNASGLRTFYLMNGNRRWSDSRWNQFQAEDRDRVADMKTFLQEELSRRGLPKQSWYLLAELIGMQLQASADVVGATVNRNRLRHVASALVDDLADAYVIRFANTSRATFYADGAGILNRVIRGRIAYFRRNLQTGVFQSLEQTRRKYPALFTLA